MTIYGMILQVNFSVVLMLHLLGGLEHCFYFSIQLGMSSSQLTFTPSFFRGVGLNHQPVLVATSDLPWRVFPSGVRPGGTRWNFWWQPVRSTWDPSFLRREPKEPREAGGAWWFPYQSIKTGSFDQKRREISPTKLGVELFFYHGNLLHWDLSDNGGGIKGMSPIRLVPCFHLCLVSQAILGWSHFLYFQDRSKPIMWIKQCHKPAHF